MLSMQSSTANRFYFYFSPASFWGMGYFCCVDKRKT